MVEVEWVLSDGRVKVGTPRKEAKSKVELGKEKELKWDRVEGY